jgi:hypothetical protein
LACLPLHRQQKTRVIGQAKSLCGSNSRVIPGSIAGKASSLGLVYELFESIEIFASRGKKRSHG